MSPEQTARAVEASGLKLTRIVEMHAYQYGAVFKQLSILKLMPLSDNKNPSSPSVFLPTALLREARRQKGLATVDVPAVCILDPDGDIVRRLRHIGQAQPFVNWPCYHTALDTFTLAGQTVGVVGYAVGAPFAVLIAEELFASNCQLLVSITSAGQITPAGQTPYFRHHRPRAS